MTVRPCDLDPVIADAREADRPHVRGHLGRVEESFSGDLVVAGRARAGEPERVRVVVGLRAVGPGNRQGVGPRLADVGGNDVHSLIIYYMSGPVGDDLLARLREKIPEAGAAEAAALAADGAVVVDVRETAEIAGGTPQGSVALPKGYLELHA